MIMLCVHVYLSRALDEIKSRVDDDFNELINKRTSFCVFREQQQQQQKVVKMSILSSFMCIYTRYVNGEREDEIRKKILLALIGGVLEAYLLSS